MSNKRPFLMMLLVMGVMALHAQRTLMSPYSRYGYGILKPSSMGGPQAMGGLGYGLRSGNYINQMNPAAYSSVDSLTFMMELGVSGAVQGLSDGNRNFHQFNGSLDYVAFQFPLAKWAGMSFGLSPFSEVGYEYSTTDIQEIYRQNDSLQVVKSFSGDGGLTQVYLGVSFDIADRVALGVNAHYLFGKISHGRSVSFPMENYYVTTNQSTHFNVSAFVCDLGLQYHQPIAKNDLLTIGLAYSFKLPMKVEGQTSTITNDTLYSEPVGVCDYPQTIGAGVSYHWGKRVLCGFDVSWQQFSNARFLGESGVLRDRLAFAIGAEYVHHPGSKRYYENMRFRLGANYAGSYVDVKQRAYQEYAVSMGVGFPIPNSKTLLNFRFAYGRRETLVPDDLSEQYFEFGLGVSLNEMWFVKRKIK